MCDDQSSGWSSSKVHTNDEKVYTTILHPFSKSFDDAHVYDVENTR